MIVRTRHLGTALRPSGTRLHPRLPLRIQSRTSVVALAALLACRDGTAPAPSTPAAAFDLVWKTFDTTYPYFGLKNIDWNAARTVHRPDAERAADVIALNTVLLRMLGPLRDVHVSLESPTGQRTPTYTPTAPRNFDQALWQRTFGPGNLVQVKPNLARGRVDGVAYLIIGSWNTSQFSIADLDAALETFRNDTVLIVDVRPNGGGNDQLALQFAGRFTGASVLTEIIRTRSGPRHNDLGNEVRRMLAPRGPWTFRGRVYVLSGRGVFSSNESFIAAMRVLPTVTVLGDTTGGATANPKSVTYLDGWKVSVSTWYAALPDGTPIEGRGIPPDVFVPFSTTANRDPVIVAAVSLAVLPRLARGARPGIIEPHPIQT